MKLLFILLGTLGNKSLKWQIWKIASFTPPHISQFAYISPIGLTASIMLDFSLSKRCEEDLDYWDLAQLQEMEDSFLCYFLLKFISQVLKWSLF